MKKKSSLGFKLKQYSTFAGVVIASSAAHGQIVYTDLNPDVIVDGPYSQFNLDLNNDNNYELVFSVDRFGVNQDYFSMYIVNAFDYDGSRLLVYPAVNGGDQVRHLYYGYEINGAAERWRANGFLAQHFYNNDNSYPWANTEAYVGVKFHDNFDTQNHFGWVRIAVNSDPDHPTITIKDYAYNAMPAQKIIAGEGIPNPCSDSFEPNNSFSDASIIIPGQPVLSMINAANDKDFYQFTVAANEPNIQIVLYNLPKNYDIKLFDASKQLIETAKNKKKENDTIIYNNAAAGAYYVKVYQKDNAFDAAACYSLVAQTSSSPFKMAASQHEDMVEVNLFPNPATDLLTVQFDDELQSDALVSIFDLEGKQVMNTIFPAGESTSQLNVSSLAPGMYLLKAIAGNQAVMKKFSVVKG